MSKVKGRFDAISAGPHGVCHWKGKPSPPSPASPATRSLGALSAGPHGMSKVKGRFGALSAGPHGISDWQGKGRRAQPSQNQCQRRFSSDDKLHASRGDSSNHASSDSSHRASRDSANHKVYASRPPPVSQLVFKDDSQSSEEEWMDLTEYLKAHPCCLVADATQNHLNMEVAGFGLQARYNLSEDTGVPLFESLVLLALANSNRGYCIKRSFTKENLLVCPRLKQLMFKSVISDELEAGPSDCNRAASYAAAERLMRELLQDNVGPNVISQLLAEPRDLLSKLERPSDERLIVYHPTFLSTDGRLWYYLKMYRLVFKVFNSKNRDFRKKADTAVSELAYTRGNLLITDVIQSHPLLSHIESEAPADPDETDERPEDRSDETDEILEDRDDEIDERPEDRSGRGKREKLILGKKIVALHRHTIEHAFDKDAKQVQSNQVSRKKLWPYSIVQVVDFLKSIMPLHLLKSQEVFLTSGLWNHLNIDTFWSRDLTWIGGVPEPSKKEVVAIRKSFRYGRRRLDARKYDKRTESQGS